MYKVANWKFHSIARNVPVSMFDVRYEGRESLGIGTKEYLKCLNNPEDKCTLENAMCFFLFEHGSDIGGFQNFLPLSARLIDWAENEKPKPDVARRSKPTMNFTKSSLRKGISFGNHIRHGAS